MKRSLISIVLILTLIVISHSNAQLSRKNQWEIYAGFAFPQSPDGFKDYWKVGISLNAQYVYFPTHRIGIPLFIGIEGFATDQEAISNAFREQLIGLQFTAGMIQYEVTDTGVETDGSAGTIKIGTGIRPYLTKPESSIQFFLFGNISLNILNIKQEFNSASVSIRNLSNNQVTTTTLTAAELEAEGFQTKFEDSSSNLGLGLGMGIEIPAGSSINIIIQGMVNVIFTQEEESRSGEEKTNNISFVGLTAGIAF